MKPRGMWPKRRSGRLARRSRRPGGVPSLSIGIVLPTDVQAGWALAIIGLITLSGQVARAAFGLRMDGFWLVVGTGFLLGGIWELAQAQVPLVPVLLIADGLAVILSSFWPKGWKRKPA